LGMSERVPEGWKKIDLEDGVSALVSGQSPNRKENAAKGTAFGILKTTAINWGRFDEQQNQEVLDEYEPNKKHLVLENDILITKAGPAHRVGVVAQAKNIRSNVLLSGKMTAIRVNDKFFPDFLSYALCQEEAQNHLQANTTGMASSQTNFTHDSLLRVPVLTPPLPEQKKIASILTSVDEVIETTQKKIDKLQDLKKATRNELLTRGIGHTEFKDSELGRIPKSWEIKPLGKVSNKVGSGVTPRGGASVYQTQGVILIRSQNIHFDGLKLKGVAHISEEIHAGMKGSIVHGGDVLLNITGASIGRCTVVPQNFAQANVNQHVCIIRTTDELHNKFLNMWLSSDYGQDQIMRFQAGGNREGLNFEQIRSIQVPVPHLDEQERSGEIIDSIQTSINEVQLKLHQTQFLKKSLMQDLLTGKVRVQVN